MQYSGNNLEMLLKKQTLDDETSRRLLSQCVDVSNITAARMILAHNPAANYNRIKCTDQPSHQFPAIYKAISKEDLEMVKFLIEQGSDFSFNFTMFIFQFPEYVSCFQRVMETNNAELLSLTIEKFAVDFNKYLNGNNSYLRHCKMDVFSLYVDKHLKGSLTINFSPLFLYAIEWQQTEKVALILKNGLVNINKPLQAVLREDQRERKEEIPNPPKGSYLLVAIQSGFNDIVDLLLQYGPDMTVNDETFPPLHGAVGSKNLPIMTLLLKHGADVNSRFHNLSALDVAVRYAPLEAAQLLLAEKNISLKTVTLAKKAAIHFNKPEMIELLNQKEKALTVVKPLVPMLP